MRLSRILLLVALALAGAAWWTAGMSIFAQPPTSDQPSSTDLGPAAAPGQPLPLAIPSKTLPLARPPQLIPAGDAGLMQTVEQQLAPEAKSAASSSTAGPEAFLQGGQKPASVESLPMPENKNTGKTPAKTPPAGKLPVVAPDKTKPQPGEKLEKAQDLEIRGIEGEFNPDMIPVDLATVLKLAGVNNLEILVSRQRVTQAVAERQLAVAQILPSLHLGTSYDDHAGNLQQSSGNILNVNRSNVYFGAGAYAIAAGTVNIPGIGWNMNLGESLFGALMARQFVEQMRFASRAVELDMLRRVALAYTELLRAEGRRALALLIREEAREVLRVTAAWATAGAGRDADRERAAAELAHREVDVFEAEGAVLIASTRLAELLNLDPSTRLHISEDRPVPSGLVPDPIPLPDLIAIALLNRPDLQERRAAVRKALLAVGGAKMLPFSPNVIIGISYGGEGGGSDLVAMQPGTGNPAFSKGEPRFGNYAERFDFDAVAFWTLQNLGVGNLALIRQAQANFKITDFDFLAQLDRARAQVAQAYAASHARFAQIKDGEDAVVTIKKGYELDYLAVKNNVKGTLPIELLNSLILLGRSRLELLEAIIRYNQAQIDLYVALGQPPADVLARETPPPSWFANPTRPEKERPKDGR